MTRKATNPTATALLPLPENRFGSSAGGQTDNLDECTPHFGHIRKAYHWRGGRSKFLVPSQSRGRV
jgi:hypothetical protein